MSGLHYYLFVIVLPFCFDSNCQTSSDKQSNEIIQFRNAVEQETSWIQIYPNPSCGKITISSSKDAEIYIVSTTGSFVQTDGIKKDEALEMELPKGQYIINIKSEEQIIPKRIIVN